MTHPAIYTLEDHQIDPQLIAEEAKIVIRQLKRAGYEAYLVGGGVRDLCLGKQPKDFDIATSAHPEQIKPLFRHCLLIGRRFRLAHVRFKKMIVEVATFRAGDSSNDDLIIHDNTWGDPEGDAERRDFTFNGLFYDIDQETIIDYVDGFKDLQKRVLRTIGEPCVRFRQDPVRMLRLLKFQARYPEMKIDRQTQSALQSSLQEIVKSSPARLLEEILRMLESGYAAAFFSLMSEHGLLKPLMADIDQEIVRGNQRLMNYLKACDQLPEIIHRQPSRDVLFASLVYCLIEPKIEEQGKIAGRWPRPHELSHMAQEEMEAMKGASRQLPKRMKACMSQIIGMQARLSPFEGKLETRRRAKTSQHPDFYEALTLLQLRTLIDPHLSSHLNHWLPLLHQTAQSGQSETDEATPAEGIEARHPTELPHAAEPTPEYSSRENHSEPRREHKDRSSGGRRHSHSERSPPQRYSLEIRERSQEEHYKIEEGSYLSKREHALKDNFAETRFTEAIFPDECVAKNHCSDHSAPVSSHKATRTKQNHSQNHSQTHSNESSSEKESVAIKYSGLRLPASKTASEKVTGPFQATYPEDSEWKVEEPVPEKTAPKEVKEPREPRERGPSPMKNLLPPPSLLISATLSSKIGKQDEPL